MSWFLLWALRLWALWLWAISPFLVRQNFPQIWQWCPPEFTCFPSMWLNRLVDLVTRWQSAHCHWPPPRQIIFDRISASSLSDKKQQWDSFRKKTLPTMNEFSSYIPSGHSSNLCSDDLIHKNRPKKSLEPGKMQMIKLFLILHILSPYLFL